ncbi:MAG: phytoene desaturase family protein [Myxococcota bacterium]
MTRAPAQGRWAVVGGGVGALTAAGELARAGLQVTLFEATARLGGKAATFEHGATRLDTGPTLVAMPGVVRDTFARLQAGELLPKLTEVELQCVYRWGNGRRLEAWRSAEQTLASARAQFGEAEARGLEAFYAEAKRVFSAVGAPWLDAPYEGPVDLLLRAAKQGLPRARPTTLLSSLQTFAERSVRAPELRQFLGRFATYAGASPWQASAVFSLIPFLEREEGVFHAEGGAAALANALATAVQRLGVEVRLGQRVDWRRDGDGWLVGGERFDGVIVGADPLAHLGREREPLTLSGYVAFFEAPRRLALAHHEVAFSDDYRREFDELFAGRVPDDLTLYLCHPSATDATMSAPGTSGVYAMVNAPTATDAATLERLRTGLRRALDRHFPELAGLAPVGERTPADLERLGAPRGSIYGFLPAGVFGSFRRPRIRGDAPGLYFAGGGTHPGGGLPMVMLSGRFAAQSALGDLLSHRRPARALLAGGAPA